MKAWLREARRCFVPVAFERVRAAYDRSYAERTDRFAQSESWVREQNMMIDRLALAPSSRVLDFGCNTGRLVSLLRDRAACDVYGIDHNAEAVAIARASHPGMRFDVADGARLPYTDAHFDAVVMSHVIGHLPEPARTLEEVRRVLRPGGRLGVLTPNRWYKLWMILPNLVNGYRPDPTILRYYSPATLAQVLRAASFRVVSQSYVGEMATGSDILNWPALRARLMAVAEKSGEPSTPPHIAQG